MDTTTRAPEVEPSPRRQNVHRGPTPAPESAINNTTENSLKTSALPSPICFRIRGIPPHWESEDVMEHLKNHMQIDSELDWKAARLSGPFPSPFGDRQCALLNLDRCTDYLGTKFSDQNTKDYSVVEVNQKTFHMVIDRHFYDLTPLNKPSLPIVAEYVSLPIMLACRVQALTLRPIKCDRHYWPGRPRIRLLEKSATNLTSHRTPNVDTRLPT